MEARRRSNLPRNSRDAMTVVTFPCCLSLGGAGVELVQEAFRGPRRFGSFRKPGDRTGLQWTSEASSRTLPEQAHTDTGTNATKQAWSMTKSLIFFPRSRDTNMMEKIRNTWSNTYFGAAPAGSRRHWLRRRNPPRLSSSGRFIKRSVSSATAYGVCLGRGRRLRMRRLVGEVKARDTHLPVRPAGRCNADWPGVGRLLLVAGFAAGRRFVERGGKPSGKGV